MFMKESYIPGPDASNFLKFRLVRDGSYYYLDIYFANPNYATSTGTDPYQIRAINYTDSNTRALPVSSYPRFYSADDTLNEGEYLCKTIDGSKTSLDNIGLYNMYRNNFYANGFKVQLLNSGGEANYTDANDFPLNYCIYCAHNQSANVANMPPAPKYREGLTFAGTIWTVYSYNGSNITQFAKTYVHNNLFMRCYNGTSGWSSWKMIPTRKQNFGNFTVYGNLINFNSTNQPIAPSSSQGVVYTNLPKVALGTGAVFCVIGFRSTTPAVVNLKVSYDSNLNYSELICTGIYDMNGNQITSGADYNVPLNTISYITADYVYDYTD